MRMVSTLTWMLLSTSRRNSLTSFTRTGTTTDVYEDFFAALTYRLNQSSLYETPKLTIPTCCDRDKTEVEHPVTEWIAEINLPEAQVAVGMGIPLWQIPRTMTDKIPEEEFMNSHILSLKASASNAALVSNCVGYLEKGQIPLKHISLVHSQVSLNIEGSKYTITIVIGIKDLSREKRDKDTKELHIKELRAKQEEISKCDKDIKLLEAVIQTLGGKESHSASEFPIIAPPIPPPTDAGDHYGRRFNNVELKLWKRQLAVYRANWEPYRDAGYEFMGVDVDQQDRWRAVT
ncbi:hypothetical protein K1719_001492 [Acacia pycnantha]|nr:hypothetical protein K1719_001492 [Acacia pycnantha]